MTTTAGIESKKNALAKKQYPNKNVQILQSFFFKFLFG